MDLPCIVILFMVYLYIRIALIGLELSTFSVCFDLDRFQEMLILCIPNVNGNIFVLSIRRRYYLIIISTFTFILA